MAIENAKRNYMECNNTKHDCFKDVIARDLRPFKKKGINEEMIEAARTRYHKCRLFNINTPLSFVSTKVFSKFDGNCTGVHFTK